MRRFALLAIAVTLSLAGAMWPHWVGDHEAASAPSAEAAAEVVVS